MDALARIAHLQGRLTRPQTTPSRATVRRVMGRRISQLRRESAYRSGWLDLTEDALDERWTIGDFASAAETATAELSTVDVRSITHRDYLLGRYAAGMYAHGIL